MKNFQQPGDVMTTTAPADAASGAVVKIGALLGVAAHPALSGAPLEVCLRGVHRLPKTAGAAIAQGAALRWDVSAGAFVAGGSADSGDVTGAAVAFEAAASADTTIAVLLPGVPGTVAA